MAPDHVVQQTSIQHRARDRADLVEAGRERDRTVPADAAVRGLEPDGAGHVGGLADGPARVGTESQRGFERRDGRGGASAGTPGDPVEIPRIVRRSVRGVLGGGAHGELVHVGLAERNESRRTRSGDDGRIERRQVALEDAGSTRGRHVGRDEHVLDGERDARHRSEYLAGRAATVDVGRDLQCVIAHVQEGMDVGIHRGDPVEVRLGRLDARDLARRQLRCEVCGGEADQVRAHCSSPRMAVTRKRPSAASGAFCRAWARVSVWPTSSGR